MTKLFIFTLSYIFYSCSGSSTGPENTELPLIQNYQFNIDEDSQLVSTLPKTNNSSRGLTYTIKTNPFPLLITSSTILLSCLVNPFTASIKIRTISEFFIALLALSLE